MRILVSISLIFLLFSCNTQSKKAIQASNDLVEHIRKTYKTNDVSTTFGSKHNLNGEKETYVQVSVRNSKVINDSKWKPELFASEMAFRLFRAMGKTERKKYDTFSIEITQNNRGTEFIYNNKRLQEVENNILYMEHFFQLIQEKEYTAAKGQFKANMVDTSKIELATVYESLSKNLGELRYHELQSFEIVETQVNTKTYRILKAYYKSFYQKKHTLSSFALLMDEPDQKLVNIEIE
jgi:hypothetical protein